MPVRLLITITTPSVEAADAALAERVAACRRTEAEEEGCLQYEVFRSALRPERFVLCELWSSRAIYDKHWKAQLEREKNAAPKPSPPGAPQRRPSIEIYEQALFERVNETWMPADVSLRSETVRFG